MITSSRGIGTYLREALSWPAVMRVSVIWTVLTVGCVRGPCRGLMLVWDIEWVIAAVAV